MRKAVILLLVLAVAAPMCAQTRQQWRDSLDVLNTEVRRNPGDIDLRLKKAEANINLEQWDFAVAEYGDILRLDDQNLAALYFRAFAYERQQQYGLARADYETFLSLQPRHFEARLGLAHVLQKMGRRTETLDELNTLVEQHPDSATAYAARAAYETELKQWDTALYDWDEAIRLAPGNVGFAVSKSDILIHLSRFPEARRELDAAVRRGANRAALREWYDRCK